MDLIEVLRRFNRKERFHLLHHVLGCEKWSFRLGDEFRMALGSNIGEPVPGDALVMMDYHLDWISMAVWLSERTELPTKQLPVPNEAGVAGNQEDIDLLVAFRSKGVVHLVLVEAKGDTPWSNGQLKSKATRLRRMFGDEIPNGATTRPHFVLMAPKTLDGNQDGDVAPMDASGGQSSDAPALADDDEADSVRQGRGGQEWRCLRAD